jgi:hypothetical protein
VSARPPASPPPGGSAWGPRVSEANAGAGPTGRGRAPDPTRCRRLRNNRTRLVDDTDGEGASRREDRGWSEPDTSAKASTR